jgi:hypothetical protein
MIGSRASAALLAALLANPGAAFAQAASGAPVPLAPSVAPPPTGPAQPSPPPRAAPGRTDLPVAVDRLAAVDPDSVGLIGDGDGGLGVGMWNGTARALAVDLVRDLPAPLASPAMRSLARRLLLTNATAPDGKADTSLLATRARKLVDLGATADAAELIRAAPPRAGGEALARVEVDGRFYANDNGGACAKVRGIDDHGGYWQQALAYCLALAGETEKASIVTDLMRERGAEATPVFFGLIDALLGDKNAKIDLPPDPNALTLAMMRTANRKLPDSAASSARAAVLRVVALSPNADLGTRLAAAERAAMLGALRPSELAEIEAGVPFAPDELARASEIAASQWGPRARSLLLRAALAATAPQARAEILKRGFALARDKGGLAELRLLVAPALKGFLPAPETMDVAADVGTALYLLGRPKEAEAWYVAVEQAAPSNEDAARAWTALWPLARLAVRPGSWDASMTARWRAAQGPAGAEAAGRARAETVFALFEGLGQRVPSAAWNTLVADAKPQDAALPDPAVLYALDHAAREKRRAECVALALIALGPRGPSAANPLALGAVVGALANAGLEADARAIAVEAAAGG